MGEIAEENIEVEGKVIGTGSTIKLSVKTAIWIISSIFTLVMIILTYSYFSLKNANEEFTKTVDDKIEKVQNDVTNIRLQQEEMKGDIKLILDRQSRDNPIIVSGAQIKAYEPPDIQR